MSWPGGLIVSIRLRIPRWVARWFIGTLACPKRARDQRPIQQVSGPYPQPIRVPPCATTGAAFPWIDMPPTSSPPTSPASPAEPSSPFPSQCQCGILERALNGAPVHS